MGALDGHASIIYPPLDEDGTEGENRKPFPPVAGCGNFLGRSNTMGSELELRPRLDTKLRFAEKGDRKSLDDVVVAQEIVNPRHVGTSEHRFSAALHHVVQGSVGSAKL